MRQTSFYTVMNAMSISTALLIYLLPGDDLKNTNKPYIVAIVLYV